MGSMQEKLGAVMNNRWLVFVASIWIETCSGMGYLFGSISPVIKSVMRYDQRQIALVGVAKVLGGSVGFIAGYLCEILPIWAILLIGALHNFLGYGFLWLIVTQTSPIMPLWVLCVSIFVATNGETYFNTGALVSCVQNFPKSRGPIVGILKGFAGLSGAILTQVYATIVAPKQSSLLFMVAVGPTMVAISLMFIIRPVVGSHRQTRPSDSSSFLFVYSICLLLAAYLMGILLVEDLFGISQNWITILTVFLLILIILPIVIPILSVFSSKGEHSEEESLLSETTQGQESNQFGEDVNEVTLREVQDESPGMIDQLPASERHKRIVQFKQLQVATDRGIKNNQRKGPSVGEDFTLLQAIVKLDFLLMFASLLLASGSGLTVLDNMGQIVESLGYSNTHMFVSMISIWNFLGRVGGGYLSEIIVQNYAYPRPVAMALVQAIMAVGLIYYAMAWPGAIYVVIVLVGLGFGAHWAIVPAAVSELFGLKSFGALYNILPLANVAGSLIFSGVIASSIYDSEAEKQSADPPTLGEDKSPSCHGFVCYSLTCGIMSGVCIIAVILSLIVVHRTKSVYAQLYGKSHP